jgi:hypothetical protein
MEEPASKHERTGTFAWKKSFFHAGGQASMSFVDHPADQM